MKSYDKNSNEKISVLSDRYVIKIKEIIPKSSKKILDKIDDVLAKYFGFSERK